MYDYIYLQNSYTPKIISINIAESKFATFIFVATYKVTILYYAHLHIVIVNIFIIKKYITYTNNSPTHFMSFFHKKWKFIFLFCNILIYSIIMLYIAKINIENGGFMLDIYFLENTNKDFTDLYLCYCGMEQCAPLYSFGPAIRPNYLLHYVLDGKGYYYVNNEKYEVNKNEGFLICPNVVTFYQADEENP